MKLLAHLEMMRPYTLFHAGSLGFAAALFLSEGTAEPWRVAFAFLVPTLGWLAGLYAGDYYDRDLDRVAKPHRPVPSGRVGAREAFAFMVGYIGVGYVLALVASPLALIIAVLTTVSGVAYSKTFKRHALLGNLDRGLLAVFTVLFGAAAAQSLDWGPPLLALCGIFFFHDSFTNLVGAIRDRDGDREAGYRTVPVVYGIPGAVTISALLALLALLFALPLFLYHLDSLLAVALFAAALLMAAVVVFALLRERDGLSRRRALWGHKVLVIERLVLSAAVAAISGPAAVVLILLAAVAAATALGQAALRNRYEFAPPPEPPPASGS